MHMVALPASISMVRRAAKRCRAPCLGSGKEAGSPIPLHCAYEALGNVTPPSGGLIQGRGLAQPLRVRRFVLQRCTVAQLHRDSRPGGRNFVAASNNSLHLQLPPPAPPANLSLGRLHPNTTLPQAPVTEPTLDLHLPFCACSPVPYSSP